MDYIMRVSMTIDTKAKKDAFRDFLKNKLETEYGLGNIKSWSMNIEGVIKPDEDIESYSSEGE